MFDPSTAARTIFRPCTNFWGGSNFSDLFTGSQRVLQFLSVQCSNACTYNIHGLYGRRGTRGVLISCGMYTQVRPSCRRKLKPRRGGTSFGHVLTYGRLQYIQKAFHSAGLTQQQQQQHFNTTISCAHMSIEWAFGEIII